MILFFCSPNNTEGCSRWCSSHFICSVSLWICSHCLSLYEIVYSSTFSPRVAELIHMNANTHTHTHTLHIEAHACPHTHTVNMLTHRTLTHHSIHHVICCFFAPSYACLVSSFSHRLFTPTLAVIHTSKAKHTHAQAHTPTHTHKVARLVGAMAAALLRSPRVAPGARLPVVCQRLRVEFIQIKAVEWGPSPRMPRPSPSSAFRRWE